jgi:succinate-semialdehyde dehydrogenase/glutarate-semialdehyde dehydrogenase
LFIDGAWRAASNGATIAVVDPATEDVIAHVPDATDADVDDALASAARGFAIWRSVGAWERTAVLRRMAVIVRADVDRYAAVMTAELSKPLAQSVAEVLSSADQFDWYADEARRIYGRTVIRMSVLWPSTVRP